MNTLVDEAVRIVEAMKDMDISSDEYQRALESIEKIHKMVPEEVPWYDRILKNGPLVSGIFGGIGTGLVLWHERAEIITSRAFGWIRWK